MRPLRYLNGRTPSPVPAEARHLQPEKALVYNSFCWIRCYAVVDLAQDDDSKESLMHSRTRDLLARGWRFGAKLSFFLFLLLILGFVLPSLCFEKHNLPPLRRHHVVRGIGR